MVVGVERSGRGFHFNFLLEHLFSLLYYINFPCFIKALSNLQNPTEFVFYLQGLKKAELIKISNVSLLLNKWLNFEIIRQILKNESKDGFDELEKEAIKNVLDRIRINDFDFFKQTVIYFNNSCLFNASLGGLLLSSNNSQIEELILECFSIDKYHSNLKARDSFNDSFVKSATDEQYHFLLTITFNKWKSYFNNILDSEDYYQNGLLITDFANFVVNYHSRLTDDSNLVSMMKSIMDKIKYIDSDWSTSNSQQITKFHLYHSELFLLTFSYRNKRLNDPIILASYTEIIINKIQLSRYISEETSNYFKQGRQNIDWMNGTNL
jgi:hypothetical protein